VYEDDQGQTSTGVSAINKLININKVDCIIGGAMSSVAMAIAPISLEKKIVLLSPTATDPELSNAGKYFFRIWPSDNYDGKVMAIVARDSLNFENAATLYINVAYGQGINSQPLLRS
jgi:branched-chain amino acid transport system substrate-binding protein